MIRGRYYMNKRIKDKINDIETYLEQLAEIKPKTFKGYEKDFKTKAACERYFEKIAEAVIDLTFLIINEKGFKTPEEDSQAFTILEFEKIINNKLANKLKDMKGMRNIIAYQYGEVNDELMFIAINEEIENDVNLFLDIVKKLD